MLRDFGCVGRGIWVVWWVNPVRPASADLQHGRMCHLGDNPLQCKGLNGGEGLGTMGSERIFVGRQGELERFGEVVAESCGYSADVGSENQREKRAELTEGVE